MAEFSNYQPTKSLSSPTSKKYSGLSKASTESVISFLPAHLRGKCSSFSSPLHFMLIMEEGASLCPQYKSCPGCPRRNGIFSLPYLQNSYFASLLTPDFLHTHVHGFLSHQWQASKQVQHCNQMDKINVSWQPTPT